MASRWLHRLLEKKQACCTLQVGVGPDRSSMLKVPKPQRRGLASRKVYLGCLGVHKLYVHTYIHTYIHTWMYFLFLFLSAVLNLVFSPLFLDVNSSPCPSHMSTTEGG